MRTYHHKYYCSPRGSMSKGRGRAGSCEGKYLSFVSYSQSLRHGLRSLRFIEGVFSGEGGWGLGYGVEERAQ